MKDRIYLMMDKREVVEVLYIMVQGKKPSHVYQSPDVTVHVFGTFKQSGITRQNLDYRVMLILQDKGLKVGQLYHE